MNVDIHPTAIVSPEALIGEGARIGPYCMVGERVEILTGLAAGDEVVTP